MPGFSFLRPLLQHGWGTHPGPSAEGYNIDVIIWGECQSSSCLRTVPEEHKVLKDLVCVNLIIEIWPKLFFLTKQLFLKFNSSFVLRQTTSLPKVSLVWLSGTVLVFTYIKFLNVVINKAVYLCPSKQSLMLLSAMFQAIMSLSLAQNCQKILWACPQKLALQYHWILRAKPVLWPDTGYLCSHSHQRKFS